MLHELIRKLGNVDETVLMHADIHKGAEVDDVSDGSRQDHIGLEVGHIEDIVAEDGSLEGITEVATGLFKLADNIEQSGFTMPSSSATLTLPSAFTFLRSSPSLPARTSSSVYPNISSRARAAA